MEIGRELREAMRRTHDAMNASDTYCLVYDEHTAGEALSILQLGLAVFHDKPITILIPHGVRLPNHLKVIAVAVEPFDRGDQASLQAAMTRLIQRRR